MDGETIESRAPLSIRTGLELFSSLVWGEGRGGLFLAHLTIS